MQLTKLSLVAIAVMTITTNAHADGSVTLTSYYITAEGGGEDLFGDNSQLGLGAKVNYSKELFSGINLNLGGVAVTNMINGIYTDLEGGSSTGFFNVLNLQGTFADTTITAGRQLVDTPLVGGFDWLMAPGSFEAITAVNKSIENVTLVGGYLTRWRPNNSGQTFNKLNGGNWTIGGVYGAGDLGASLWYYNVDATNFKAVYGDVTYKIGEFDTGVQVITTDYNTGADSLAFAAKVGTTLGGIGVEAAVSMTQDNTAGYVGRDSLYTSSWNRFASDAGVVNDDTLSWKVGAGGALAGIDAALSYAQYGDEGSELDLILGYNISDATSLGVVFSNTDYDLSTDAQDAVNVLEVFVNYTL